MEGTGDGVFRGGTTDNSDRTLIVSYAPEWNGGQLAYVKEIANRWREQLRPEPEADAP
jgi:hypothetical protein